jgi:pyruvate,water dikinase
MGRSLVKSRPETHEALGQLVQRVGGKAANLARLAATGVTVPPFRVLEVSWFDAHVGMLAGRVDSEASPNEELEALDPGPAFRSHLAESLAALRRETSAAFLAVRSSAVGEDSAEASFAGQFDTVLNVPANDAVAVERAVRRCWRVTRCARRSTSTPSRTTSRTTVLVERTRSSRA